MTRENSKIFGYSIKVFSEYLKAKICSYRGKDLTTLVKVAVQNGGLFTAHKAILGMAPKTEGVWEVLFLAADNKEGRKQVMRDAIKKLNPKLVVYTRSKHNGREYVRGPEYWERLLA